MEGWPLNPWKIKYDHFDPDTEILREALCTLGNGYVGVRGAVPETAATRVHYPGTYVAGVYNSLKTPIAGRDIVNEDFVNCPNWLMFNYRVDDGPWFNRLKVKILSWKMELNMQKGILSRNIRWRDNDGRVTRVENQRVVSMADPHVCAIRFSIIPENYDGKITVRTGIDGLISNAGVERYRQLNSKHLKPLAHGEFGQDGLYLTMQTIPSGIKIAEVQRTIVYKKDKRVFPDLHVLLNGRERIMHEMMLDVKQGQRYSIEKLVSIYTSRDHGVDDPCALAQDKVLRQESFQMIASPHQAKWKALWNTFDIQISGDPFMQQALRLHIFHLLQSASIYNDEIDAGLPARGLHGEAYRGHIFWDEIYSFSFYNLHAPEITRALLMYRYRRLGAAKDNARQHGYKGAMYPWQSASTGEETTQEIHLNPLSGTWGPDYSCLQRHVSIAIAYNVWTYYYSSGDRDFLDRFGMEMLLEISQFWSSIAHYNKKRQRYEIHGVMGPDEFHEKYPGSNKGGLKNNAYTNVMVSWVLDKTLDLLKTFGEEEKQALLYKVQVTQQDLERWYDISRRMFVLMDDDGLIHQFEGYMDLQELDWDGYRKRYENVQRMDRILKAEGLSPDSFKVAKQADTLMLFYMLNHEEVKRIFENLGYSFTNDTLKKNYDYYVGRTSHGSTLSRVVHAYLAFRLGYHDQSEMFYRQALESDMRDIQGGTTQEGIHVGVMAGTIDFLLRCYAGLVISEDRICFYPEMPSGIKNIKFKIRYKNIWFNVILERGKVRIQAKPFRDISLQAKAAIPIELYHQIHYLIPGKTAVFDI